MNHDVSQEQDNLILAKKQHQSQKRLRAIFNGTLTPRNRPKPEPFSMDETVAEIKRRAARQAAVQQTAKDTKPGRKKRGKKPSQNKQNNHQNNHQNKAA